MARRDDTGVRGRFVEYLDSRGSALGLSLAPATVWLVLLLLAPLTFMVVASFAVTVDESYDLVWQLTLDNYEKLFTGFEVTLWPPDVSPPFLKALALSYFIATVTTVLCLVLAFPLAYLLARRDGPVFKLLVFLVLLPFFTMYIIRAYSWTLMFGSQGVFNTVLEGAGLVDQPLGIFGYGIPAIIVALVHAYYPYMLLSLYASLDGMDFSLIEAARDLGASRREVLTDQVIPLTLPGIIGGSMFVFVPSVGAFITPALLGVGKVQMVGQFIEGEINQGYSLGKGSAESMFLVATIVIAFLLAFRYVSIEDLGGA